MEKTEFPPPYTGTITIMAKVLRFSPEELNLLKKYADGRQLLAGPLHDQWIKTSQHDVLIEKGLIRTTLDSTDTSKTFEATPLGISVIKKLIQQKDIILEG